MSDATPGPLGRFERPLLYLMSAAYVFAGVMHVLKPRPFERIVPAELPRPRALVYLSGLAEVALGAGLLLPRTRSLSAKGIVLLLLAVFPANVNMAVRGAGLEAVPERFAGPARTAAWLRLPFQAVLVAWAWWYTTSPADGAGSSE